MPLFRYFILASLMKKAIIIISTFIVLVGCLSQEIKPTPDQTTRGCLIKENITLQVKNNTWFIESNFFEYNKDGNPSKRLLLDSKGKVKKMHIIDYEGNRIKTVKKYLGNEEKNDSLESYKTYDISNDFLSMVVHIYVRKPNTNVFYEYNTQMLDFIRNERGELKLTKVEIVKNTAKPKDDAARTGSYYRYEYDSEYRNFYKVYSKEPNEPNETLIDEVTGSSRISKNPWNANIWLSLMANYSATWLYEDGDWNESSPLVLKDNDLVGYYLQYEVNSEGFPCSATIKKPDYTNFPGELKYYYYNCDCK